MNTYILTNAIYREKSVYKISITMHTVPELKKKYSRDLDPIIIKLIPGNYLRYARKALKGYKMKKRWYNVSEDILLIIWDTIIVLKGQKRDELIDEVLEVDDYIATMLRFKPKPISITYSETVPLIPQLLISSLS